MHAHCFCELTVARGIAKLLARCILKDSLPECIKIEDVVIAIRWYNS